MTTISDAVKQIGDKLLIVDLIGQNRPRAKTIGRIEVKACELQEVLAQRPHLAQLALF